MTSDEQSALEKSANINPGDVPWYMGLADEYGLGKDMDIGNASKDMQTIKNEYQAYITSLLSPKNTSILKFLEVNGNLYICSVIFY